MIDLSVFSPPSLDFEVLARSFRAPDGDLGLLPADVWRFLDACDEDGFEVLGWELWIADHAFDPETRAPRPMPGQCCAAIPALEAPLAVPLGGAGEADAVRRQIAGTVLPDLVEAKWLPHLRYNIKLGG